MARITTAEAEAEKAKDNYTYLVKEVEQLLGGSEIKIEENPAEYFKRYIYIKLDADKIDGKLKGYLEHRVKILNHLR